MTEGQEMFDSLPWPFPNGVFPKQLGAVVMRTVASGQLPALHVLHDPDNRWAIADGVNDQNAPDACFAQHIWHLLTDDPSLAALAHLPPGTQADRLTPDSPWEFNAFAWDEE